MTIVSIEYKKTNNKIKEIKLCCDHCNIEYLAKYSKLRVSKSILHFCTILCSISSQKNKNGALAAAKKKALLEKYNGKYYCETEEYKDKLKQFCLKTYGVEQALLSSIVREKIKQTNIKRYGSESFAGTSFHKEKVNYNKIVEKSQITKKKNKTHSSSAPEEKMYKIICEKFGAENVDRQVSVLQQRVDFYISTIDTYLQVDGEYWHGLNRPREQIEKRLTIQDEKICKQILRDETLDKYMTKNNLILKRITDIQMKKLNNISIIEMIMES